MTLCKPLEIVLEREMRLQETIVVNPQEITRYVEAFAREVKSPEGKQWFLKKLRVSLINSPALLRQIKQENSLYPDYANTALAQGQPVYEFDENNAELATYEQKFHHIVDWFNSMTQVLERKPTNELEQNDYRVTQHEFSKIMKYDPETALVHADEWFKLMGTRLTGTKEGVEVVYTWPDGFYAVRYTDKNTMMLDGRDLQNCLAHGTYWNEVQGGNNVVYGIRNPNDEAVVGIRVSAGGHPEVIECKGKNNQPVSAAYRRYVADFFNFLQASGRGNHDLKSADIHYNNGKFGTFVETAELIYDKNGLKVWKGDDRIVAQFGKNNELDIKTRLGLITHLQSSARWPAKMTLGVLNILKIAPASNLANDLQREGVAWNSDTKTYGSLEEVGKVVGEVAGMNVISLGERYILLSAGKLAFQADVDSKEISSVAQIDNRIQADQVAEFLNIIRAKPTPDILIYLIKRHNIAYNGDIYGQLEKVMTEVYSENDAGLYRAGSMHVWVALLTEADDHPSGSIVVMSGTTSLRTIVGLNNNTDDSIKLLIKRLIRDQHFTSVAKDDQTVLGVKNLGKAVATNIPDLFANIQFVAKHDTLSANDMPYAHISRELYSFLDQIYYDSDRGEVPEKGAQLLAKHMIPKTKVTFKPIKIRTFFGTQITDYEIIFPVAAIELLFVLEGGHLEIPPVLEKALEIGFTQAIAKIKASPNDMFTLDKESGMAGGSNSLTAIGYRLSGNAKKMYLDLRDAISKQNSRLVSTTRDKLEQVTKAGTTASLSDRFAAMNLQRSLQGKK